MSNYLSTSGINVHSVHIMSQWNAHCQFATVAGEFLGRNSCSRSQENQNNGRKTIIWQLFELTFSYIIATYVKRLNSEESYFTSPSYCSWLDQAISVNWVLYMPLKKHVRVVTLIGTSFTEQLTKTNAWNNEGIYSNPKPPYNLGWREYYYARELLSQNCKVPLSCIFCSKHMEKEKPWHWGDNHQFIQSYKALQLIRVPIKGPCGPRKIKLLFKN